MAIEVRDVHLVLFIARYTTPGAGGDTKYAARYASRTNSSLKARRVLLTCVFDPLASDPHFGPPSQLRSIRLFKALVSIQVPLYLRHWQVRRK